MENLITIESVKFRYAKNKWLGLAVENLEIKKRKVYCVIGSSGCGKTTFLKILAGLLFPTYGELRRSSQTKISMTFQDAALLEWSSVLENILLFRRLEHGKVSRQDYQNTYFWLEKLGLEHASSLKPYELSGGMRQRVALIRALVTNPSLILMDEPLSSLDYNRKYSALTIFDDFVESNNASILMVTHDLDSAVRIADELIVLGGEPASITFKHSFRSSRKSRLTDSQDALNEALIVRRKLIERAVQ